MADVLKASWNATQLKADPQFRFSNIDEDFICYTVAPPPCSPQMATKTINFLLSIKPNSSLKSALRKISVVSSSQSNSNVSVISREETKETFLFKQIDISIESILYYLSASNWDEIYSVIIEKLEASTKLNPDETNDSEIIPALEIFGNLYLDASRTEKILFDFYTYAPKIKVPLNRLMLEYFLQQSIHYSVLSHPAEFSDPSPDTPLSSIASKLFDFIYSCSDDDKRRPSSWKFLSTLIALSPISFDAFLQHAPQQSSSKLKVFSSSKLRSIVSNNSSNTSKSSLDDPSSLPSSSSSSIINKKDKQIQKKISFLNTLSKLSNSSSKNPMFISFLVSYTEIVQAAAILSINAPDTSLVHFARSVFNNLLNHLFLHNSHSKSSKARNWDEFQHLFVTSYSVLCPDKIISEIFPMLKSDDDKIIAFIPSILQGCIQLRLIPCLIPTFQYITDHTYSLFRDALIRSVRKLKHMEAQPGFTEETMSTPSYTLYASVILKVYFIYTLRPELLNYGYTYQRSFEHDPVFYSVANSLLSQNLGIREQAFKFAWSFVDKSNLASYDPDEVARDTSHPVYTVFLHIGKVAQFMAEKVLAQQMEDEDVIEHLRIVKNLAESRCFLAHQYQFSRVTGGDIHLIEPAEVRREISEILETTMLIFLLSNNTHICKLALEVLNWMVQEAIIVENLDIPEESTWSIVNNFSMYSELSSTSYVITGAIAVHKRLYHFLRNCNRNTKAVVNAWKYIIVQWRDLTYSIRSKTSLDRELAKRWRAYGGFLASSVSSWLVTEGEQVYEGKLTSSSKKFLTILLDLITDEDSFIRETSREILSRDTNHSAFHFVFISLEERLTDQISKENSSLTEKDYSLLEQSVLFLRAIIDYINDGEVYLAVDIASLALSIVKKLDTLDITTRVIKLHMQYANLMALITKHKDVMNLKHDLHVRNEVAIIFASWLDRKISFQYSSEDMESVASSNTYHVEKRKILERERLQKDCIASLIESFAAITLKMKIEVPADTHEKDVYETKSHKFSVYIMLLLRILEKCRAEELHTRRSIGLGDRLEFVKKKTIEAASKLLDANVDVGLRAAFPLAYHEDPFIRISFIKILDNILSHSSDTDETSELSEKATYQELAEFLGTNLNISLSLCDVCPATEVDEFSAAILKVFENQQNALGLVKAVVTKEVERADTPVEILRRNCVATKILSIYAHELGYEYLKTALSPFIKEVQSHPELYVFETNPDKIPEGETIEQNLTKFDRTLKKLLTALDTSMYCIPAVFREICLTISETAENKYAATSNSRHASVNAISAFFFLRFICPSLVSPETDGLVDEPPSKDVRRTMLILAKMIQNLAYGSNQFVKLSIFKNAAFSFRQYSVSVVRILKSLTTMPDAPVLDDTASSNTSVGSSMHTNKSVDLDKMAVIHKFMYSHWEDINHKIQTEMKIKRHHNSNSHKNSSSNGTVSNTNASIASNSLSLNNVESSKRSVISSTGSTSSDDDDFKATQRLTSFIRNLGRPRQIDTKSIDHMSGIKGLTDGVSDENSSSTQIPPRLKEFLARNSHRNMDSVIEQRIITEGLTKEGMPLLVLNTQNYVRDSQDTELIVCRYFHVASKIWNQKFGIFYDSTNSSADNFLSTSAKAFINLLVPDIMANNCICVYFYNVPLEYVPHMKTALKQQQNGTYLNPLRTKFYFITTQDIIGKFNLNALNLDPKSLRVLHDAKLNFTGVQLINSEKKTTMLVSLRLGSEYLQIQSQDPYHIMKGVSGFGNSVYSLRDIHRVELTPGHSEEMTIYLIQRGEKKKLYLKTNKASDIVRSILNSKSRMQTNNNTSASQASVTSPEVQLYQTLESGIGSFLNIAFSSLCSNDHQMKNAAYNLLATTRKKFNLDLDGVDLIRGKGLKLPANVFSYIRKYSRSVAETRPELSHSMIDEMFEAYKSLAQDRRQGVLMYISPWIKNMAKHIYSHEGEIYQKGTCRQIIRKLLELCLENDQDYMFFLQDIWPLIIKESDLLPILVDELLSLVLKSGLVPENKKEDVMAILTAHQSLEACELLINRILDIALQPACIKDNKLANHPQWPEVVLLISALSSMLFENPQAVVKYCADLCLIVQMHLYTGPYSFRLSLYNMLANMTHSLLYSDSIKPDNKAHIMTIWKDLTSNKGSMIFGISDEMKNVENDFAVTSIMFQIESCSSILLDLARSISASKKLDVYHERFSKQFLLLCTQRYSILQSRAIVTLGCISRFDISDDNVTVILEVLLDSLTSDDYKMKEELITCAAFSISKMATGLRVDSKYHGYLFWVAIATMNTQNMRIFSYGLQLLQTVLKSLDEYGVFKEISVSSYLLKSKEALRAEWEEIEELMDLTFTRDYFEIAVVSSLIPGMVKSSTRAETLQALETLLTIAARNYQTRGRESSIVGVTSGSNSMSSPGTPGNSHSNGPNSDNISLLSDSSRSMNPYQTLHHSSSNSNLHAKESGSHSATSSLFSYSTVGHRFSAGGFNESAFGDEVSANSISYVKDHPEFMIFLFFLYLGTRSKSNLRDYLWIAGYLEDLGEDEIPTPLQRFISSGNTAKSTVALYLGALLYNQVEDEETLTLKFLKVLKFVGESISVHRFFPIYFVVRSKIKKTIDLAPNVVVIKAALSCAKIALLNLEDLSRPTFFLQELNAILKKAGLGQSKCSGGFGIKNNNSNSGSVNSFNAFYQHNNSQTSSNQPPPTPKSPQDQMALLSLSDEADNNKPREQPFDLEAESDRRLSYFLKRLVELYRSNAIKGNVNTSLLANDDAMLTSHGTNNNNDKNVLQEEEEEDDDEL